MNRTKKLIMSLLVAGVVGLGASAAQAQETPPPSEPPPSPPPAAHKSSSGGDGAGIGIGATIPFTPNFGFPAGLFVYDMAVFHIEALFGVQSQPNPGTDRTTDWIFGAGGWYHLHRGASSDLSVGGVIAINYLSQPGGSNTLTAIEPGGQVRVFLTPNVALHARGGFAMLLGDSAPGGGANFTIGAQPVLLFGFSYFLR